MKPEQSRGSQASSRKDSYPSVSALQLNATTLERRKTPSQELGSRSQGYFKKNVFILAVAGFAACYLGWFMKN
jgi:hypothetical protein